MKVLKTGLILLSIFTLLVLTGCNMFSQTTITSIEIDQSTVLDEYDINTIDITMIDIIVHNSDGSNQTIPLSTNYLSSSDLALLSQPGVHTITITYQNQTTQLTITLIDVSTMTFTVTFNGDGGTLVSGTESQTITYGQNATPPVYEKEGYTFNGWTGTYSNITNDLTITAKWIIIIYTVTFDGNGGNLVSGLEVQSIPHGGEANAPVFARDGFILTGWSEAFDNITQNMTVVAVWNPEGPVYTLKANDTYEFTTHTGNPYQLYIPDMYEGKWVTSIAADALKDKTNLQLLSIGKWVRIIGDYAFANCANLKEIYISADGPVTVNENAFEGLDPLFRFYTLSNLKSYFKQHLPTLTNHVLTHPGMHLVTFNANGGTLVHGEEIQFIVHGGYVYFPTYELDGHYLYWEDSSYIYEDKTITAQWTDITPSTSGSTFILKSDGTYELQKYYGTDTDVFVASHHQGIPITSIGNDAFSYRPINSVTISEGITNIKSNAFGYRTTLATVHLPNSLSKVGSNAFIDTLWYQNLPDGMVIIGDTLYGYKGSMPSNTAITVPLGIKYIASFAFSEQSNLTSLTLPEGLREIGYEAFFDCTNLVTISFPSTLSHIQSRAFMNTAWLNNQADGFVYAGSVLLTHKGLIPMDTPITIPNGIKGIAANALQNQYFLKTITLPDGLLVVGDYAFSSCYELTTITLPNTITYIGQSAFGFCYELVNITLPNDLLHLGELAFSNCTKLESIILPNLLTSIEYGTFYKCTSLTSVTLGSHILVINERAFLEATSLSNITFNNKLQRIGKEAFVNTAITEFNLPESLLILEDFALASGVIETIYVGNNFQQINLNFASIGFVVSPDNLYFTSIDGSLYTKDGKTLIRFPIGISPHGNIPQGTEVIKQYALTGYYNLETITLPESVAIIEEYAIANNPYLKSISIFNPTPPLLGEYNFIETNDDWVLYVPVGTATAYANWAIDATRVKAMQNTYGVTFDLQGGTLISGDLMQIVAHGQSAIAPIAEKDGYALSWNTSFDYVTSMLIVRAVWTPLVDVHFDPFGGTLVSGALHQQVPYGSSAVAPILEMENFTFVGWYGGSINNITQEITLIALWEFNLFQWEMNAFEDGIIITGLQPGFEEEHLVIHEYYSYLRVTGIRYNAFQNATFLKSVTIDKNIKDIGSGIFHGCTSLEEITLSFKHTNNYYTYFEPMAYLAYYFGDSTQIENSIPQSLKRVTVHEGINKIPSMMFQNSYHLEEVILPEGIIQIDTSAFYNCHALKSVTIPSTVEHISQNAFYFCHNLQNVILPNGLKTIGDYAFRGNTSLTSIVIPNQVTSIGHYAFYGCTNLEAITLSNQLLSIGTEAFRDCNKLTEIILPNALQTIGQSAFSDCYGLESIHIPENVTTIGSMAFNGCTSLASITVDSQNNYFIAIDDGLYNKNVTTLHRVAQGKVGSYIVPATVTTLSLGAFRDCTLITDITLPNAINDIPMYAFSNCTSLVTINIPTSCHQIGNYAFANCISLTELKLPENLSMLGNYAFSECVSLDKIEVTKPTPPSIQQYTFQNISPNLTIHVPEAYYDAYRFQSVWWNFNYIKIMP